MCCLVNSLKSEGVNEKYQKPKLTAHLGVRWCQALPAVDSDQGVLLHRDVELEEAWLLQIQLGAPEHPRWDALADSLPDVNLARVDGAVLLVEHTALPCGDGNMEGFHAKPDWRKLSLAVSITHCGSSNTDEF